MKGYALGQAIDRMARLPLVVCSLLVWIGGVLSRPKVFAALVVFIAAGVWMHGGLGEIYWPQWAKITLPQWSQPEKKFQFHTYQDQADVARETRDAMAALSTPIAEEGCEFPLSEKMQSTTPCKVSVIGGGATVYLPDGKVAFLKTGTKIDFVRLHDDSSGYAVVRLRDSIVCWPGGNWSAPLESIPLWERPHYDCQDRLAARDSDQSEQRMMPTPTGEGLMTSYSLGALSDREPSYKPAERRDLDRLIDNAR
jgi:hypothetical protein